jgi:UTP--glucose-1-phosphate uridylyltransferase
MGKIKKGVIAAGGRGTRFLPVVKAYPKELLPLLNKPNLQYLVEEMVGAGIKEIAIIERPGETAFRRYFTPDKKLAAFLKKNHKTDYLESLQKIWQSAKIVFIPQPEDLPYGNASPVLAAEKFLAGQPFVYMYGDDLVFEEKPGSFLSHLLEVFQKYNPGLVMGVQEVPWSEIDRYGSVAYKKSALPNQVEALLEKLPSSQAPSNKAAFGRFVVSSKMFSILHRQKVTRAQELWFADAVNTLAKKDLVIAEPIKQGEWLTTGDPLRWLKANLVLGFKDKDLQKELKEFLAGLKML